MTTTNLRLKETLIKAEEKQKQMYNCLYDLRERAGVLEFDEQYTNPESGKPRYKTQRGCCNIHAKLTFQGSHN
jgi:hypothetical protein